MKELQLSTGESVLLDNADYEWAKEFSWHRLGSQGYAARTVNRSKQEYLHRLIVNAQPGQQVDHINRNPLDNRRANLRLATAQQNAANRSKEFNSQSEYKGVSWSSRYKKWQTNICFNGEQVAIGTFDNPRHAALAYDLWALDLFGDFAHTNFPAVAFG